MPAFHLALARAVYNSVYLAISEAVRQPLLESMRVTYSADDGPAHRQQEHASIYEAVRQHRPDDARRSCARCSTFSVAMARQRMAIDDAGDGRRLLRGEPQLEPAGPRAAR